MFACFTPRGTAAEGSPDGKAPAPHAVALSARAMPVAPPRAAPARAAATAAASLAGPAGTHARAFARALVEKAEYR